MAETANIARIAELISDSIFSEFFWKKVGPVNSNWDCEKPDIHHSKTHPTDVVFFYEEPYRDTRTYVQCDLKSYAADSINRSQIENSLLSLSKQVSCAEVSQQWQNHYVHQHKNFEISGLLFIYNHDGGFDREFADFLEKIKVDNFDTPENGKLVVLGPPEIHWLNNVSQEITRMRGKPGPDRLPTQEWCSFFYPQAVLHAREKKRCAATLEMLTGPWIILQYDDEEKRKRGIVIFYRPSGETINEYLYLLDYLRQHGLLDLEHAITIRSIDKDGSASINFQKAKQQYIEAMEVNHKEKGSLYYNIENISYSPMNNLTSSFSEIQIGMGYDR